MALRYLILTLLIAPEALAASLASDFEPSDSSYDLIIKCGKEGTSPSCVMTNPGDEQNSPTPVNVDDMISYNATSAIPDSLKTYKVNIVRIGSDTDMSSKKLLVRGVKGTDKRDTLINFRGSTISGPTFNIDVTSRTNKTNTGNVVLIGDVIKNVDLKVGGRGGDLGLDFSQICARRFSDVGHGDICLPKTDPTYPCITKNSSECSADSKCFWQPVIKYATKYPLAKNRFDEVRACSEEIEKTACLGAVSGYSGIQDSLCLKTNGKCNCQWSDNEKRCYDPNDREATLDRCSEKDILAIGADFTRDPKDASVDDELTLCSTPTVPAEDRSLFTNSVQENYPNEKPNVDYQKLKTYPKCQTSYKVDSCKIQYHPLHCNQADTVFYFDDGEEGNSGDRNNSTFGHTSTNYIKLDKYIEAGNTDKIACDSLYGYTQETNHTSSQGAPLSKGWSRADGGGMPAWGREHEIIDDRHHNDGNSDGGCTRGKQVAGMNYYGSTPAGSYTPSKEALITKYQVSQPFSSCIDESLIAKWNTSALPVDNRVCVMNHQDCFSSFNAPVTCYGFLCPPWWKEYILESCECHPISSALSNNGSNQLFLKQRGYIRSFPAEQPRNLPYDFIQKEFRTSTVFDTYPKDCYTKTTQSACNSHLNGACYWTVDNVCVPNSETACSSSNLLAESGNPLQQAPYGKCLSVINDELCSSYQNKTACDGAPIANLCFWKDSIKWPYNDHNQTLTYAQIRQDPNPQSKVCASLQNEQACETNTSSCEWAPKQQGECVRTRFDTRFECTETVRINNESACLSYTDPNNGKKACNWDSGFCRARYACYGSNPSCSTKYSKDSCSITSGCSWLSKDKYPSDEAINSTCKLMADPAKCSVNQNQTACENISDCAWNDEVCSVKNTCAGAELNYKEFTSSSDTISPTPGQDGTQNGGAQVFVYDINNFTVNSSYGIPGKPGTVDLKIVAGYCTSDVEASSFSCSNYSQKNLCISSGCKWKDSSSDRFCKKVLDYNSDLFGDTYAKDPSITLEHHVFTPIKVGVIPIETVNPPTNTNAVQVYKKLDSSIRNLIYRWKFDTYNYSCQTVESKPKLESLSSFEYNLIKDNGMLAMSGTEGALVNEQKELICNNKVRCYWDDVRKKCCDETDVTDFRCN